MAGEAIRAVGKLTRVPVIPAGIRGKTAEHLPSSSSSLCIPLSAHHVAAKASSGEEGAGELLPRVLFDGEPTLQEARKAISELVVGIEELYPRYNDSDGYENSVTAKPAVPTIVFKAFKLLRESSEVQDAVASLACDPNVLKAVRENLKFQEILHSQKIKGWALSNSVTGAERLDMLLAKSIEYSSNHAKSKPGFSFENFLDIFKVIVDLMKSLPDIFHNLLGGQGAKSFANGVGAPGPGASADELIIETCLLGLAIIVIMILFF